jgi:hypothetical protein
MFLTRHHGGLALHLLQAGSAPRPPRVQNNRFLRWHPKLVLRFWVVCLLAVVTVFVKESAVVAAVEPKGEIRKKNGQLVLFSTGGARSYRS